MATFFKFPTSLIQVTGTNATITYPSTDHPDSEMTSHPESTSDDSDSGTEDTRSAGDTDEESVYPCSCDGELDPDIENNLPPNDPETWDPDEELEHVHANHSSHPFYESVFMTLTDGVSLERQRRVDANHSVR